MASRVQDPPTQRYRDGSGCPDRPLRDYIVIPRGCEESHARLLPHGARRLEKLLDLCFKDGHIVQQLRVREALIPRLVDDGRFMGFRQSV